MYNAICAARKQFRRCGMFEVRFNEILMAIGSKSHRELAKFSNYDTSYVSRMSRGERIPKYGADSCIRLIQNIYSFAEGKGRLAELGQLIGVPPGSLVCVTVKPSGTFRQRIPRENAGVALRGRVRYTAQKF